MAAASGCTWVTSGAEQAAASGTRVDFVKWTPHGSSLISPGDSALSKRCDDSNSVRCRLEMVRVVGGDLHSGDSMKICGKWALAFAIIAAVLLPNSAAEAASSVVGSTPTITGELRGGGIATAVPGRWTKGAKLKFAWSLDSRPIARAAGKTIELTNSMIGHVLTVTVTGTKSGMRSRVLKSKSYTVGQIEVLVPPAISGNLELGSALTLSDCACNPAVELSDFQWMRDGIPVEKATGRSYVLRSVDYSSVFSVSYVASAPGYERLEMVAQPTDKFLPSLAILASPTISFTNLNVGATLTASPGAFQPTPSAYSYQWLAGGQPLVGQVSSTLVTTASMAGQVISVQVSATAQGYRSTKASSTAVGPIKSIKVYRSGKLDANTFFLNCGGTGYRLCERDTKAISENVLGIRLYAGTSTEDAVVAIFGLRISTINPSDIVRWRVVSKGWGGLIDPPAIQSSRSSSWLDSESNTMSLLSSSGTAISNWYTTPMGGPDGHSLYWGIFQPNWGSYYVDNFVVEVEYLG